MHGEFPDGNFVHPPEPLAENLTTILPLGPQHQASVGFVLDPDADRLALIDEKGRYIGEELTLALAVLCRLQQERGPIVINMSSSRITEDIAKQFGVECHRAAVGEANVVEKMREVGALIGGEGNGGVIDPRVGWVRDPFIGMALVLQLLAETGKTLSELVAELPSYAIVKDKYTVARELLPKLNAALEAAGRKRRRIALTACASTGPIAGSTCGRATPSRSCASSPRRRAKPLRRRCARMSGRCCNRWGDLVDVLGYNREAWNNRVAQKNRWTTPVIPEAIAAVRVGDWHVLLTPQKPVPRPWFPELVGLEVLCLASGGGQQGPILAAAGGSRHRLRQFASPTRPGSLCR